IGWRLDDVVDLIRGPKGTTVRLRITPNPQAGSTSAQVLAITRDRIKLEEQAAQRTLLEVRDGDIIHRIGVIDVPTFYVDFDARARGDSDYRSTTRDVRNLIAQMEHEGIDGLVIDLRGNGGGALAEATALTGLFIPSGPVVQVRDSRGRIRVNHDPNDDLAYAGPLAVIVDRDSASASEIFSGAIQDYERGLVIGESTFGKGTVQNLIDLDRYSQDPDQPLGQLKLTIAQFFRVNGESTQHRGVVPDIILPIGRKETSHGERALDNALPWTQIDATDFSIYEQSNYLEHIDRLRSLHRARVGHDPDFAYLKGIQKIEAPLAQLTEVPLLESLRSAERVRQQNDRQALLKTLVQAHGLVFKEAEDDDDLPRDAALFESARILADLAFGAFTDRLIVQLDIEPTPIDGSSNRIEPLNQ
ncbi:MAG: carboxy terminal-processing peptidase, partial [Arenicellales bacterium]|nr:carboxy terminal-processing peptidase [Arenicellales bacterium]